MKIRNVSVSTFKNHIETEIVLDDGDFLHGCHIEQKVESCAQDRIVVFNTMVGVPSARVLTCGDAVPAVPSTKENPFFYNLITELFDDVGVLIDRHEIQFEFTLPKIDVTQASKKKKKVLSKIRKGFLHLH